MPSAPPSSADSRNTPNAIAGSRNVVSATVKSVNHDVPPSMSEGICKVWQACAHVLASGPTSDDQYWIYRCNPFLGLTLIILIDDDAFCRVKRSCS